MTRYALQIPSFTFPGVADSEMFARVVELAKTAEETGYESVWVMDHLNMPLSDVEGVRRAGELFSGR